MQSHNTNRIKSVATFLLKMALKISYSFPRAAWEPENVATGYIPRRAPGPTDFLGLKIPSQP